MSNTDGLQRGAEFFKSLHEHQTTTKIYGLKASDKTGIYSFFPRPKRHDGVTKPAATETFDEFFYNFIHLHCQKNTHWETKGVKSCNSELNYSSQNNTVIFVDCEGLTPRSDAGLTDKSSPIISCLLQKQDTSRRLRDPPADEPHWFPSFFGSWHVPTWPTEQLTASWASRRLWGVLRGQFLLCCIYV